MKLNHKYTYYALFAILSLALFFYEPHRAQYQTELYSAIIINDIVLLVNLTIILREINLWTVAFVLVALFNLVTCFNVDLSLPNLDAIFVGFGIWGHFPEVEGMAPSFNYTYILLENFVFVAALIHKYNKYKEVKKVTQNQNNEILG